MLYLPQSPINIVSSSAVAADPGSLVLGAYDSAMTGKDIYTFFLWKSNTYNYSQFHITLPKSR